MYVCSGEGIEGVCGVCMCVVVRALREVMGTDSSAYCCNITSCFTPRIIIVPFFPLHTPVFPNNDH